MTIRADYVIMETMPEWLRASHRAAGNWGTYPHNGAQRAIMLRDDAEDVIDHDDEYDHTLEICRGAVWSIEEDDDEPEQLNGPDGPTWVVSTHTLRCDGLVIASWTRCAVGSWGGNGGPGTHPDAWEVDEDDEGGDRLPDDIAELLESLRMKDYIPSVPEPDAPSETIETDPDGEKTSPTTPEPFYFGE